MDARILNSGSKAMRQEWTRVSKARQTAQALLGALFLAASLAASGNHQPSTRLAWQVRDAQEDPLGWVHLFQGRSGGGLFAELAFELNLEEPLWGTSTSKLDLSRGCSTSEVSFASAKWWLRQSTCVVRNGHAVELDSLEAWPSILFEPGYEVRLELETADGKRYRTLLDSGAIGALSGSSGSEAGALSDAKRDLGTEEEPQSFSPRVAAAWAWYSRLLLLDRTLALFLDRDDLAAFLPREPQADGDQLNDETPEGRSSKAGGLRLEASKVEAPSIDRLLCRVNSAVYRLDSSSRRSDGGAKPPFL